MRRFVSLALLSILVVGLAHAQSPALQPPSGGRSGPEDAPPQGAEKLRWVCKQLGLDEAQWQQAEALLVVYEAEIADVEENKAELLMQIQEKFAELQAARESGDQAEVARVQKEMRALAPGIRAENNFFDGLKQVLDEKQIERLPRLRERAESLTSVSLRPVHIWRAAWKTDLDREQMAKLEAAFAEYRKQAAADRPESKADARERVDALREVVAGLLTDTQKEGFDAALAEMEDAGVKPATAISVPQPAPAPRPQPEPQPATDNN
jgi:DNA-binding protein H-NS